MIRHFILDYPATSFSDFAPGAPPFNESLDMQLPEMGTSSHAHMPEMPSTHVAVSAGGRPTLKAYLDMMKANKMPLPGKQAEGEKFWVKILPFYVTIVVIEIQ
jgi:hypothetical protein